MKIDDFPIGARALAPLALSIAILITLGAFRLGVPSEKAADHAPAANVTMIAPY